MTGSEYNSTTRRGFLKPAGAAAASSHVSAANGDEIFHVAIFRFRKEHVNDAMGHFGRLLFHRGENQDVFVTTSTAVLMTIRSSMSWSIGCHWRLWQRMDALRHS